MRRILSITAAGLLAVSVSGGAAAAAAADTAPARIAASAPCTGIIDITQLAFSPATVVPGQSSMLNLTAVNCTSQPVNASLISYGRFLGSGVSTGVPQGCPVIDPLSQPVTLPPNGTYTTSIGFPVFAQCTATALNGIVRFDGSGGTLASGTARLTITQPVPPVACHVSYTVQSEWPGGFTAAISITDTGTVPDNGWTLAFTFPGDQKITNAWNATTNQSGESVTLTNMSYNATISPGATLSGIGFEGSWTSSAAVPSSFTLNGTLCS